MNDSLLVQSYVDAYDLSYPEALRQIETEVDEIYQRLDEEGYGTNGESLTLGKRKYSSFLLFVKLCKSF